MKARIKHTDTIIDVEWYMFGWLFNGPKGERVFDTEELDFLDSDNIDWKSFRAEAAKDILCSMISSATYCFAELTVDSYTDRAIRFADNLISKLKEKKEI